MVIRSFVPADAPAVNAVATSAFAQYRDVYSDWDLMMRGVGAMASLATDGEIIVADTGGAKLAGAVAYFAPGAPKAELFDPHWPIIRMLVVDPERRGNGTGRRLTQACIACARRDGAELIALHTSPVMEVALGMYLRMGFTLLRPVPDRHGVPYGVYTLDLKTPR